MLAVITIAHLTIAIGAALVGVIGELCVRITVDDDVAVAVSRPEIGPQLAIGTLGVALNDGVQGRHQRLVTLVLGIVIVPAGYRCH